MESACESAQNLSFNETAQATIQEEPKPMFRPGHIFSGFTFLDLPFATCPKTYYQGWIQRASERVCSKSSNQRSQSRSV